MSEVQDVAVEIREKAEALNEAMRKGARLGLSVDVSLGVQSPHELPIIGSEVTPNIFAQWAPAIFVDVTRGDQLPNGMRWRILEESDNRTVVEMTGKPPGQLLRWLEQAAPPDASETPPTPAPIPEMRSTETPVSRPAREDYGK